LLAYNIYKIANKSRKLLINKSKVYSAFDYQARVASYLESLPPEMLKSLKHY